MAQAEAIQPVQEVGDQVVFSWSKEIQLTVEVAAPEDREGAGEVRDRSSGSFDRSKGGGLAPRGEIQVQGPVLLLRGAPAHEQATARDQVMRRHQRVARRKACGDPCRYRAPPLLRRGEGGEGELEEEAT
jgi:hypothetical protein